MQLKLKLYGPFAAVLSDGTPIELRGDKQIALLAMLAASPDGKRSRQWLQEKLWSRSGSDLGRASLRQAVSSLKHALAAHFDQIFDVTRDQIAFRPRMFSLMGHPGEGVFLDGINVREDGFENWLAAHRAGHRAHEDTVPIQSLLPSILVTRPLVSGAFDQGIALSDALTHQISRALSRSQLFFVISHLSSRGIDPRTIDLIHIRDRVQACYVVAGNLRYAGGEITMDLDLIETKTGQIMWTRSFTTRQEVFSREADEFICRISSCIGQTILAKSIEITGTSDLPNVESHALMMSALILMNNMSKSHFSKARQLLEELVRRKPRRAELEAWLAQWYLLSVSQGWSQDPDHDRSMALDWSNRALDVNPLNPTAQIVHANIQNLLFSNFDTAKVTFRDALEADPNNAFGWLVKSMLDAFTGDGATAVSSAERANRLSPMDPRADFFHSLTATAHLADQNFEQALHFANLSLEKNHHHPSTQRVRIIALELLGRGQEAREGVASLLSLDPGFTVEQYLKFHPAAKFSTGQQWARALKSAGAPTD